MPGPVEATITYGALGAAAGALLGSFRAAYNTTTLSKEAVVKITASHTAQLAAVSAIFGATDATLRTINGHSKLNAVAAGCAAGASIGLYQGSIQKGVYTCLLFGSIQGLGAAAHETGELPGPTS